jgi:hypothetical protein
MRTLIILFAFALNTFAAGPLIIGGRGGVPLTDSTNNLTSGIGLPSFSQRYVVGPTLGLRLPFGFSVEGDALFHRQSLNFGQLSGVTVGSAHLDSWEFPAMLKFTAGHHVVAPVLGVGVSYRHINNFGNSFNAIPSYLLSGSSTPNSVGLVAGGGVRFKAGPVEITPEIRYTHWSGSGLTQSLLDILSINQNQAEVLVGFTF